MLTEKQLFVIRSVIREYDIPQANMILLDEGRTSKTVLLFSGVFNSAVHQYEMAIRVNTDGSFDVIPDTCFLKIPERGESFNRLNHLKEEVANEQL